MLSRGETKRVMREALRQRIRAEREALKKHLEHIGVNINRVRHEEGRAIELLSEVPSIFAFAEKINPKYLRPSWASQRYGAN